VILGGFFLGLSSSCCAFWCFLVLAAWVHLGGGGVARVGFKQGLRSVQIFCMWQ
jgi:hypothetical protein